MPTASCPDTTARRLSNSGAAAKQAQEREHEPHGQHQVHHVHDGRHEVDGQTSQHLQQRTGRLRIIRAAVFTQGRPLNFFLWHGSCLLPGVPQSHLAAAELHLHTCLWAAYCAASRTAPSRLAAIGPAVCAALGCVLLPAGHTLPPHPTAAERCQHPPPNCLLPLLLPALKPGLQIGSCWAKATPLHICLLLLLLAAPAAAASPNLASHLASRSARSLMYASLSVSPSFCRGSESGCKGQQQPQGLAATCACSLHVCLPPSGLCSALHLPWRDHPSHAVASPAARL